VSLFNGVICSKLIESLWNSFSRVRKCVIIMSVLLVFWFSWWNVVDCWRCRMLMMIAVCFCMFMVGACRCLSLIVGVVFGASVWVAMVVSWLGVMFMMSSGSRLVNCGFSGDSCVWWCLVLVICCFSIVVICLNAWYCSSWVKSRFCVLSSVRFFLFLICVDGSNWAVLRFSSVVVIMRNLLVCLRF